MKYKEGAGSSCTRWTEGTTSATSDSSTACEYCFKLVLKTWTCPSLSRLTDLTHIMQPYTNSVLSNLKYLQVSLKYKDECVLHNLFLTRPFTEHTVQSAAFSLCSTCFYQKIAAVSCAVSLTLLIFAPSQTLQQLVMEQNVHLQRKCSGLCVATHINSVLYLFWDLAATILWSSFPKTHLLCFYLSCFT